MWSPGGATTASITVSPASTTAYTVTVTDGTTTCANAAMPRSSAAAHNGSKSGCVMDLAPGDCVDDVAMVARTGASGMAKARLPALKHFHAGVNRSARDSAPEAAPQPETVLDDKVSDVVWKCEFAVAAGDLERDAVRSNCYCGVTAVRSLGEGDSHYQPASWPSSRKTTSSISFPRACE